MRSTEQAWSKCKPRTSAKSIKERNDLAQRNSKLVHKIVHRMSATCRESYEDLYQLGYLGLLKAAERYNENAGNAFSSFAVPYIQGEIQHYLRDQWQSVKIPRSSLELKAKVKRIKKSCDTLGRDISEIDIALTLGVEEGEWRRISALNSSVTISLEEMVTEPSDDSNPEKEVDIESSLSKLSFQQRNAILERFFVGLTIEQIAKRGKVSPECVKAQINSGLAKIRACIEEEIS